MRTVLFAVALVLLRGAPAFPHSAGEGERVDFEAMAFAAGAALGESGEVRLQQAASRGMSKGAKIALGVVAAGALVFLIYSVLAVTAVHDAIDALPEAGKTGLGRPSLPESLR